MSRTFRICGMQTNGRDLVLSALQFRSQGAALEPASITASHEPASGVLGDLLNTEDLARVCVWLKEVSAAPGFYIDLRFDTDVIPDALALGSGVNFSEFVARFTWMQQIAGQWQVVLAGDGVAWAGAQTIHLVSAGDRFFASVVLLLPLAADVVHRGLEPVATQLIGGEFVVDARALRGSVLDVDGGVRVDGLTNFSFLHDGVTPYTIDIEFLYTQGDTQALVATSGTQRNPGIFLGIQPSGTIYVVRYRGNSGAVYLQNIPGVLSSTAYSKLRFVYLGENTIRVDLNGVTVYSGAWSLVSGAGWTSAPQEQPLCIGSAMVDGAYTSKARGRIGDVRITKVARPLETKTAPWPLSLETGLDTPAISVLELRQRHWLGSQPLTARPLLAIAAPTSMDRESGGSSCIYGTVELYAQAGNIPLPRRVRLHRSRDGLLVRETWSDAQGNYRFDGITDRYTYDVIAWDHEGAQRSVIANDLQPEAMP